MDPRWKGEDIDEKHVEVDTSTVVVVLVSSNGCRVYQIECNLM